MFCLTRVATQLGEKWSESRWVRTMALTSASVTPVPASRLATVRGPMPASRRIAPAGVRNRDALPEEPLARMQSSRDIRVVLGTRANLAVGFGKSNVALI